MYDLQQLSHRSRHDGGLEWELIKLGTRTVQHNLRVISHKRLIDMLTDEQQHAMWQIAKAWGVLTAGLGVRTSDPAAIPGGAGDIDYAAVLLGEYRRWANSLAPKRLDHSMCMDVIAFGHSLREIDRSRKQRKGKAADNLKACLELFVDMGNKNV